MKTVERAGFASVDTQDKSQYVLIVTSSFPSNGGSRIDKFVKFLPRFGFKPIVLTASETTPQNEEEMLAALFPESLKIYRAKSLGWSYFTERYLDRGSDRKYFTLLKWLSLPERFIYIPDYMVRWVPHGVLLARKIVKKYSVRFVFTSSPPESTHLIGLYLKNKLGVNWVADFRDLWTEATMLHRPATPLHDSLIKKMEHRIFNDADHVIANTPDNYVHYLRRFHFSENRISLITNGFDRDDLAFVASTDNSKKCFMVGHMGNFDKQNYPWRIYLNAFKKLADHVGEEKVKFVHCGFYSSEVEAFIEDNAMQGIVANHGMLPHAEAMRIIASTSLRLVLLGESGNDSQLTPPKVPAKLYNYLIMDGPVLAIAPEHCDISRILSETRMGTTVSPGNGEEKVFNILYDFYQKWEKSELTIDPDLEQVDLYDRQVHAKRLAGLMQDIASHNGN